MRPHRPSCPNRSPSNGHPQCPDSAPTEALAVRLALRSVVEEIVANAFCVEPDLLRLPTRGQARVALARQVAMYVTHVGYGLSLTEVGEVFERDRTTVAHACSVIEHKREDVDFDKAIVLIENIVRTVSGPPPAAAVASATWPVTLGSGG